MDIDSVKIVFGGPVGTGKTTAIRSISDHVPISTDVPITQAGQSGKTTTTVALDFVSIKLEDGPPLLVYGMPGQDHFSFMRTILVTGAIGVAILLHAGNPELGDQCERWMKSILEIDENIAMVIGVTHAEEVSSFSLDTLRQAIRRIGKVVPVFTLDARKKSQVEHLIRALLVAASSA